MDKNTHIKQLIDARKLGTDEECVLFDQAVNALHGNISVADIYEICNAFYDETESDEVMFGLVHLIEQLCGEDYLKCIALCTPQMRQAHDWAMTLNKRIINSEAWFEKYIGVIKTLEKAQQNEIKNLLTDIKNSNPARFAAKIDLMLERI